MYLSGETENQLKTATYLFHQEPRVGPGPDVHSGSYSKLSKKKLNIFDELKYIMSTYKSVLVRYVSLESF